MREVLKRSAQLRALSALNSFASMCFPGAGIRIFSCAQLIVSNEQIESCCCLRQPCEDHWFPLVICKTSVEKRIDGGLGAITSSLLSEVFFKDGGVSEIAVCHPSQATLRLRASWHGLIADESAEAGMLMAKGASGNKSCFKCENVVRPGTGLGGHLRLVSWDCCDASKFVPHTKESMASIYDRLRALAAGPKGPLHEAEKAVGFTWHPSSIWAQPRLRGIVDPQRVFVDAMHTFIASNGVYQSEMLELVACMESCDDCKAKGLSFQSMERFLEEIPWRKSCQGLLSERLRTASKTAGYFKGSAGDCLRMFRMLAFFTESVLLTYDTLRPAAESFLALSWVLELVFSPGVVHFNAPRTRQEVVAATQRHLELRKLAYGALCNRHKNHQEPHIGLDWDLCGRLNCFVHERKNKEYKKVVRHMPHQAPKQWSRAIMERMLLQQATSLGEAELFDHLVRESPVAVEDQLFQELSALFAGMRELSVSLAAVVSGVRLARDDAFTVLSGGGEVILLAELFARCNDGLVAIGRRCVQVRRTRTTCVCSIEQTYVCANLEHVVRRCDYAPHGGGNILVLLMKNPALPA